MSDVIIKVKYSGWLNKWWWITMIGFAAYTENLMLDDTHKNA